MKNELTIKIAGEAGQGMQTVGMALCGLFKKCGFNIFANQDYMSRVRGGNNFFQIRISNTPLYVHRRSSDITIALDKPSVSIHKEGLSANGVIVVDKKKFAVSENDTRFFDAPVYDIALKSGGSEIFINSVSCGLVAAMAGIDFKNVQDILSAAFADKGVDIINKNIDSAKAGYDFAKDNFKKDIFKIKPGQVKDNLLMDGNDAIGIGAIRAGCKFYSAYPMTPSTSIMNIIAHYAKDFNIVVEQAEDEVAAINMIMGASFAGCRSMSATSGGGFCLMVEGLSLAAMTETPIVVVDAQRPAPATGFPTRTEQSDLEFLIHAGHGEFARAIFSPGTIEEAFYLTVKAFNLAEKYQIPVLIMTDQHLADSLRNIDAFDQNKIKVTRYIISKEDSKNVKNYKRYQLTDSGISPRAVPSWIDDVIYADSDEHTQEGHITEDAQVRIDMVNKRFHKKMAGLMLEAEKPTAANLEGADIALIGFGSTYGVLKEASDAFKDKKVGFIHLSQAWPFPENDIVKLLNGLKKIVTVENNAGAQLAKLIRRQTGINIENSILKYDGRPFDLDYLIAQIKELKWK